MSNSTNATGLYRAHNGTAVILSASANYCQWANDITILLLGDRALGIVAGTEDEPQEPQRPTIAPNNRRRSQSSVQDDETEQLKIFRKQFKDYEAKRKDYEERKFGAVRTIYGSIDWSMRAFISDLRDPKVMWDTLKDELDTASARAGPAQLRAEFHQLKPTEHMPLNEYINKLLDYQHQLAVTNDKLDDRSLLSHLLETLPDTFETTIETINNQPEAAKTKAYIFSTLRAAERRIAQKVSTAKSSGALIARPGGRSSIRRFPRAPVNQRFQRPLSQYNSGRFNQERQKRFQKSNPTTCYYCLKTGH